MRFLTFIILISICGNGFAQYDDHSFEYISYCQHEDMICKDEPIQINDALVRYYSKKDSYFIIFQDNEGIAVIIDAEISNKDELIYFDQGKNKKFFIENFLPNALHVGVLDDSDIMYVFSKEPIELFEKK